MCVCVCVLRRQVWVNVNYTSLIDYEPNIVYYSTPYSRHVPNICNLIPIYYYYNNNIINLKSLLPRCDRLLYSLFLYSWPLFFTSTNPLIFSLIQIIVICHSHYTFLVLFESFFMTNFPILKTYHLLSWYTLILILWVELLMQIKKWRIS